MDDVKGAMFGQVCSGETGSTYWTYRKGTGITVSAPIPTLVLVPRIFVSTCTVLTESGSAQSGLFQTQVYYCDTEDSFFLLQFYKSDDNLQ